jgi:hypothetical protein
MFASALQPAYNGLTWKDVVTDIPHDFGALIVYVMFGLFLFFIWWGSKREVIERYGGWYEDDAPAPVTAAGVPEIEPPVPVRPAVPIGTAGPARPWPRKRSRRAANPARIGWIG